MAKVTMPLGSLTARGQIGKSFVFFPWKSIDAVRSYVVPANPNTASQQSQRTKLKNAVNMWHATPLTATDKTAWNLFATIFALVMSGFNTFVKKYIYGSIVGKTWYEVYGFVYTYLTGTTAQIGFTTTSTTSKLKMKYGTSKSFMPNLKTADAIGANQVFSLTGLVAGVIYYFQVYTNELDDYCWTGIYQHKHSA